MSNKNKSYSSGTALQAERRAQRLTANLPHFLETHLLLNRDPTSALVQILELHFYCRRLGNTNPLSSPGCPRCLSAATFSPVSFQKKKTLKIKSYTEGQRFKKAMFQNIMDIVIIFGGSQRKGKLHCFRWSFLPPASDSAPQKSCSG